MITEIRSPTRGLIGWLHEFECASNDSVLIFQLPRATKDLSNGYLDDAKGIVHKAMPEGRNVLLIGCDVNIYEIAGEDMLALKLKGLI